MILFGAHVWCVFVAACWSNRQTVPHCCYNDMHWSRPCSRHSPPVIPLWVGGVWQMANCFSDVHCLVIRISHFMDHWHSWRNCWLVYVFTMATIKMTKAQADRNIQTIPLLLSLSTYHHKCKIKVECNVKTYENVNNSVIHLPLLQLKCILEISTHYVW